MKESVGERRRAEEEEEKERLLEVILTAEAVDNINLYDPYNTIVLELELASKYCYTRWAGEKQTILTAYFQSLFTGRLASRHNWEQYLRTIEHYNAFCGR